MSREAYERGDWQALIDAHPLESHDPEEWLRYGVALLQTLTTGPDVGKQQQQAALAFLQAQREGMSAEQVAEAKQHSALLSLQKALTEAGMETTAALVKQRWEGEQGWTHLRSQVCDALLMCNWRGAAALIGSQMKLPECKPPEGVSRQIWTELLVNAFAASEAQLPTQQLVESRSLPRSGHHYLRNLLQQACGESFSYCEGYQEPGCCKSSPCSVAAYWHYARENKQPHLRLLKSHDFALEDATFTPPAGMVRLIQVRRPLELLASWLELEQLTLNREMLHTSSISLERVFLYHEAEVLEEAWRLVDERGEVMPARQAQDWVKSKRGYVQSFLQKWLPQARPFPFGSRVSGGTYLLHYSDLARSAQILQAFGLRGEKERPLPVFAERHTDVTMRRSKLVTAMIQEQLDLLKKVDGEIQEQLPALADGSAVLL